MSHPRLLRLAGIFTWGCVAIPLIIVPVSYDDQVQWPVWTAWAISHITFGVAFWLVSSNLGRNSRVYSITLLALMSLTALAESYASESGLGGILLLIIGGVLPWVLPLRAGVIWLVAQNIAMAPVFALLPDVSLIQAMLFGVLFLGYSSFTFVTSMVARQQTVSRDEMRRINSELRATQTLLADSSRMAERLRISRELHDLIGHHLTALSLNLEVASHLCRGKAQEHVQQAHSVARLLLSDVREVVGHMRQRRSIDLTPALEELAAGVPSPVVHLQLPDVLSIDDPRLAQVLLRCVQEIITNTVKHAGAQNLWIELALEQGGVRLNARDDGRGAKTLNKGHGLTGMGERMRQLGGNLETKTSSGKGFELSAWLPMENEE